MASFNKVILIGNLVDDPELKTTPNGVPVTNFRIAVSRRYQRTEGQQDADFINIVCWRQTAEFVKRFFTKGKSILICGSLQSRTWTDNNGQKRYALEVLADEVSFVEKKSDSQSAPRDQMSAPAPYSSASEDISFEEMSTDDDLPF
ncbi:MAG: single-stranded DNA-binding protein [Ruminococcaceae bacterium]|nr:single-stranded DNA-binding protein [Oscillospiraceae bacterium]